MWCCGIALSAEVGRFWGQRRKLLVWDPVTGSSKTRIQLLTDQISLGILGREAVWFEMVSGFEQHPKAVNGKMLISSNL